MEYMFLKPTFGINEITGLHFLECGFLDFADHFIGVYLDGSGFGSGFHVQSAGHLGPVHILYFGASWHTVELLSVDEKKHRVKYFANL